MIVLVLWRHLHHRVARMRAVARIECLHLIRDRTTLALLVTVPAIQIVLFGSTVTRNPKDVPIAIARQHGGPGGQLQRTIEGTGYFSILADGLAAGATERLVVAGKALVGIELPPVDTADPDAPAAEPRIVVDATEPWSANSCPMSSSAPCRRRS
jgi:ABC-2 type transport system permease protein